MTLNLKIATIVDTFTFVCLNYEAKIYNLKPDNTDGLFIFDPDMLFVEPVFNNTNAWEHLVSNKNVVEVITWFKRLGKPTIFWNKEDPFYFLQYINFAKNFDYVFTTDINCIEKYKEHGIEKVFLLTFACQPKIYNPIIEDRANNFDYGITFCGSYYAGISNRCNIFTKYICKFMQELTVEIYDRNNNPDNYPLAIRETIKEKVAYDKLHKIHKKYKFAFNTNTVTSSPSMFSRRVWEILACNTMLISTYALGIKKTFGDLVFCSDDPAEAINYINFINNNKTHSEIIRLKCLRKALQNTYQDRLAYVMSKIYNTNIFLQNTMPKIAVLSLCVRKLNEITKKNFDRQSYKNKILFFCDSQTISKTIDKISCACDFVVFFHPFDYYGRNYILDMFLATRYAYNSIITKHCYYERTLEGTKLINDKVYYEYNFVKKYDFRSSLLPIQNSSTTILSIDKYNYCKNYYKKFVVAPTKHFVEK